MLHTAERGGCQSERGDCPHFKCSAAFQPALSRQDGGATFKLGQHPREFSFCQGGELSYSAVTGRGWIVQHEKLETQ